jgi:hypothetical protein
VLKFGRVSLQETTIAQNFGGRKLPEKIPRETIA